MMKKLKEVLKHLVRRKSNYKKFSIKIDEKTGEVDLSGHFISFNNYWFPYNPRHDKRRVKIKKIYDK
jgi:hypothetical protein